MWFRTTLGKGKAKKENTGLNAAKRRSHYAGQLPTEHTSALSARSFAVSILVSAIVITLLEPIFRIIREGKRNPKAG